jgi:hypothetical protein
VSMFGEDLLPTLLGVEVDGLWFLSVVGDSAISPRLCKLVSLAWATVICLVMFVMAFLA